MAKELTWRVSLDCCCRECWVWRTSWLEFINKRLKRYSNRAIGSPVMRVTKDESTESSDSSIGKLEKILEFSYRAQSMNEDEDRNYIRVYGRQSWNGFETPGFPPLRRWLYMSLRKKPWNSTPIFVLSTTLPGTFSRTFGNCTIHLDLTFLPNGNSFLSVFESFYHGVNNFILVLTLFFLTFETNFFFLSSYISLFLLLLLLLLI